MADPVSTAEKVGAEHHDVVDNDLAHLANQQEHDMTKLESIKKYPLACVWCLFAVWCMLLVSFENQAAGNIISIPKFREDFGEKVDGTYVLFAKWQSAFQGAPVASYVGEFFLVPLCFWGSRR